MGGYDYTCAERQQRYRDRQAIKAALHATNAARQAKAQAKALRRMSLACDRVIRKENPERAALWAKAWAIAAGVKIG